MNGKELLELLIKNMDVQSKNLDWLCRNVDENIIEAVKAKGNLAELEKEDKVRLLLRQEKSCRTKKIVYQEIKEWAENALKSGDVK